MGLEAVQRLTHLEHVHTTDSCSGGLLVCQAPLAAGCRRAALERAAMACQPTTRASHAHNHAHNSPNLTCTCTSALPPGGAVARGTSTRSARSHHPARRAAHRRPPTRHERPCTAAHARHATGCGMRSPPCNAPVRSAGTARGGAAVALLFRTSPHEATSAEGREARRERGVESVLGRARL